MKDILSRIDKNDILFIVLCLIVFLAFIGGCLGNEFAKETFQSLVVAIPTYVVAK